MRGLVPLRSYIVSVSSRTASISRPRYVPSVSISASICSSSPIAKYHQYHRQPHYKVLLSSNPTINYFNGLRSLLSRSFPHNSHNGNHQSLRDVSLILNAAASGDVATMRDVISQGICSVNDEDYDHRKPLHLAAAEGQLEAVKFLLEQKADVNATDRWGHTALDEAVTGQHDDIIKELRAAGANIGHTRMADMGNLLCKYAADGNLQALQRLVEGCGVDVNKVDYDSRTPLHVAAGEGRAPTVEFLIKHGAKVNSVDRFGNTPLGDASRSRSEHKRQVLQYLMTHGALLESTESDVKYHPMLQQSILRSLPLILKRSGAVYIEAWLPNEDEQEFQLFDSVTPSIKDRDTSHLSKFLATKGETRYSNSKDNRMSKAWAMKKPIIIDITEKDLGNRYSVAHEAGLKSVIIIPLCENDRPFAILRLFSEDNIKMTPEESAAFAHVSAGIIIAGMARQGKYPTFHLTPATQPYAKQMIEVFELIVKEEVFNANLIYHEVDWFYNLGLHKYYFDRFQPPEIANHIHALIAAKKLAATQGKPEDLLLNVESQSVGHGPTWLYIIQMDHKRQVEVEKKITNKLIELHKQKMSYTLEFFMSVRSVIPGGHKQMGLYVLESSDWNNPSLLDDKNKDKRATISKLEDVASITFLRTKPEAVRQRYQEELDATVAKISPVTHVFPTYRDGTTPIMFSFFFASGTTTSYMLQLTELLKFNGLIANRKFIETFANGVIVYSLYIQPHPQQKKALDSLFQQFSMLHLVPESHPLTDRFLDGGYTAQQYTYFSAASRFVYYFFMGRSEEFNVLAQSFKNDQLNLGRLRLLQSRLKREAVSQQRIMESLGKHKDVAEILYEDFLKSATTIDQQKLSGIIPAMNSEILNKIKHAAESPLDQQILTALLSFNTHLLKTNFFNSSKAALSFRLDPRFLLDSDYLPQIPFGLFFVMGSDFQGFHMRFQDVARGGIRIIKSRDRQAYNHNLETLFMENYNLALTQNKKNKDIPEFGSKGTILLNELNQKDPFLQFQKYTSGLLDLLVEKDVKEIVDNYGKEEILFLGPDEGTAGFMEWAALYAQKRGYPYWRSFTTGKPPSLGGIPHDVYGMTTRSVHRFVLGCLNKLGLKEEEVTKFQTGGPDGDLGSNEILIAKDKTIAIADGSGVAYDPEGLNREELIRLATPNPNKQTIKDFDATKLSPKGFKVLLTDSNIILPTGEVVASGAEFRDTFHLNELSSADVFVPCGGRPDSVNLSNVRKMLDSKGKPRFKIIVEGANLFFTQDARMVLEDAGVILYKDASANKGGVTSSSLEVLAALAMPPDLFDEHMCQKSDGSLPKFYQEYVTEIQRRIEADADLEFNCIWREHEKTATKRYLLTDHVSDKINSLNHFIQQSSLWSNVALRHVVLYHAIPKKLINLLGLPAILQRVPDQYVQAIFGAYLASRFVYQNGLDANEMQFFEFMQPYLNETMKATAIPTPTLPSISTPTPTPTSTSSSTSSQQTPKGPRSIEIEAASQQQQQQQHISAIRADSQSGTTRRTKKEHATATATATAAVTNTTNTGGAGPAQVDMQAKAAK